MYYVYVLHSAKDGNYYIGYTQDLQKRIKEHNRRNVRSTKSKIPWTVVYLEVFEKKQDAHRRERIIKSYNGGEAFKQLVPK